MKFAALSDIHGNYDALEAVLADARGRYDRILCLGDLVGYGAEPNQVVDWVKSNVASVVRGNHDRACPARPVVDDERAARVVYVDHGARVALQRGRDRVYDRGMHLAALPEGVRDVDDRSVHLVGDVKNVAVRDQALRHIIVEQRPTRVAAQDERVEVFVEIYDWDSEPGFEQQFMVRTLLKDDARVTVHMTEEMGTAERLDSGRFGYAHSALLPIAALTPGRYMAEIAVESLLTAASVSRRTTITVVGPAEPR